MAKIAIASDVAALIGEFAEGVQNRSLLLDRYSFHKKWPVETDERGEVKWDDASRWSFIRISDGASSVLLRNADALERQSRGPGVETEEKRQRLRRQAAIASDLARVNWDRADKNRLRTEHSQRLLTLVRESFKDRCVVAVGKLEGRLAINLADSLIQNAGICLDRLFGLPFIPGSGVKGVCRHAALEELQEAQGDERKVVFNRFRKVFGTAENDFKKDGALKGFAALLDDQSKDQKGAVSFLPAYPVSESRVIVDLTNVHYPDYYRSGNEGDQAKEKPQPNPFPAVEKGARFGFCLALNGIDLDPELLAYARECLENALTVRGLGAKTASGYGWFSMDPEFEKEMAREAEMARDARRKAAEAKAREDEAAQAKAKKLAAMSPEEREAEAFAELAEEKFTGLASTLGEMNEVQQRGFLLALEGPRKQSWKAWKKNKKEKGVKRVNAVREVAKRLGVPLE